MRLGLKILIVLGVLFSLSSCKESTPVSAQKPNIIFFIADDMYPEMFNCLPEGKGKNLTPNLDRLAREGVFMKNQTVVSPVCTPSRYSCLTGNYASRATNRDFRDKTLKNEGQTVVQFDCFITPGVEKTIGHYLQEMGYRTGFVGKNHVIESHAQISESTKPDLDADPNDPSVKSALEYRHEMLQEDIKKSGFDFADNLYHNNPKWLGVKALAAQNMDWIAEGGLRFLDRYKDEPTFLYFATTLPHQPLSPEASYDASPLITPKGYLEKPLDVLPDRQTLKTRLEKAGVTGPVRTNLLWVDDALGALIDKLEETNKLDNTIIVFFNDHGQHEKGTLYNGGIHSQCIIWKKGGFLCGNTSDVKVSNIDFLPTLLDFAGKENVNKICDGNSFKSALENKPFEEQKTYYHELGYARGIIKGKFKYIALRYPEYATRATLEEREKMLDDYNELRRSFGSEPVNYDPRLPYGHLEMYPGGGGAEHAAYGKKGGFFEPDQLYNIEEDPNELSNLANDEKHQMVLEEMKNELKKYLKTLPGEFKL